MISLKEACIKVLDSHPGQYVHVVNEFQHVYAFVLLDDGTTFRDYSIICGFTTVNKQTGEMEDDVAPFCLNSKANSNSMARRTSRSCGCSRTQCQRR